MVPFYNGFVVPTTFGGKMSPGANQNFIFWMNASQSVDTPSLETEKQGKAPVAGEWRVRMAQTRTGYLSIRSLRTSRLSPLWGPSAMISTQSRPVAQAWPRRRRAKAHSDMYSR